ncbi:unnamed protein product [Ilex paraguariensis]|uniref:Neoxanthin synthase n=1 Tax=Ilex paraguariensis TaxID=185542 RepID=A0ABC8S0N7_9AQUA
MTFSYCLCSSHIPLKIDRSWLATTPWCNFRMDHASTFSLKAMNTEIFGQRVAGMGGKLDSGCSFMGGSNPESFVLRRKSSGVHASWLASSQIASSVFTLGTAAVLPFYTLMVLAPKAELNPRNQHWLASSQIASSVFTLGTAAVLPFYTLMVLAPKAELTKKTMESSVPYLVLGLLYAYLLYLSWTPDTIRLMFASKYWLPELSGIAKMFSSEITLASAWIHLLAVDLFAARQIFQDGLDNKIETRHSVSLCLLFCPIGILTHFITKALTKSVEKTNSSIH